MTKSPVPLRAENLTSFTRALSRQLGEGSPSHLTLMNMLARAAGFQNVQHMRSVTAAARRLEDPGKLRPLDARTVERALRQFDENGRLRRWPSRRAVQTLALWVLWARLPARMPQREREISERLAKEHVFGDPATLRRTMVACGMLERQADGTGYLRIEQEPPEEAKALIRALGTRRRKENASPVCPPNP